MNGEFYSSPHDHIPTGNDQLDAGRARSPEKSACRCCCLRNREWSIKFVLQPIRIERWWHFGRHQPAAGMKKRNNRRGRKKRRRRIKQPAAARYYWVTRRQSYNDRLVKSLWLIGLFCFFFLFFARCALIVMRIARRSATAYLMVILAHPFCCRPKVDVRVVAPSRPDQTLA